MRSVFLGPSIFIALTACGKTGSVYDRPIPSRDDTAALLDIRDGLRPEDQKAWSQIVMRLNNPMAERISSKTVGDAVAKLNAKTACMETHDVTKVADGPNDLAAPDYEAKNSAHIKAYNKEVEAYNACLKMPI